MGSGYSAEQKKQFEPYRLQIDKAINDREYLEFAKTRDKFVAELAVKKPYFKQLFGTLHC